METQINNSDYEIEPLIRRSSFEINDESDRLSEADQQNEPIQIQHGGFDHEKYTKYKLTEYLIEIVI